MSLTSIMNTLYSKSSSRADNPVEDWADPVPLRNDLHAVVPLHSSNFPAPYLDWILDVSERMQCPADYIAVAAIVATAAVIGTGCGIKPKQRDDWLVIPNLWGGLVGHPGKLKSPAVAEALHPLGQLEAEAKKLYDADFASHMADIEKR
jgi:putative DNA primase/helicase